MQRRISPGASAVRCGPRTNAVTGRRRSPPPGRCSRQVPSRAAVSAIIGPAGRAVQRLPPTLARFQILNEPSSARQHCPTSGAAIQSRGRASRSSSAMVPVADRRRPASEISAAFHPRADRSISRASAGCGSENSQVPPASQASPARQAGSSSRRAGLRTAVIVSRSIGGRLASSCPMAEAGRCRSLHGFRMVISGSAGFPSPRGRGEACLHPVVQTGSGGAAGAAVRGRVRKRLCLSCPSPSPAGSPRSPTRGRRGPLPAGGERGPIGNHCACAYCPSAAVTACVQAPSGLRVMTGWLVPPASRIATVRS